LDESLHAVLRGRIEVIAKMVSGLINGLSNRQVSHEVWRHPATGRRVTLPHHSREMAEGTLRAMLRETGIDVEDFLRD
jgi:hypothetical protein